MRNFPEIWVAHLAKYIVHRWVCFVTSFCGSNDEFHSLECQSHLRRKKPRHGLHVLDMGFCRWSDLWVIHLFICTYKRTHKHTVHTHFVTFANFLSQIQWVFFFGLKITKNWIKFQKTLKGLSDFYTWFKQVANIYIFRFIYFQNSAIWVNRLMDDWQFSYITKLKNNNNKSGQGQVIAIFFWWWRQSYVNFHRLFAIFQI